MGWNNLGLRWIAGRKYDPRTATRIGSAIRNSGGGSISSNTSISNAVDSLSVTVQLFSCRARSSNIVSMRVR